MKLSFFLERKFDLETARRVKWSIKISINKQLSINPKIAPISSRLAELGITGYRQLLIDEHNMVFFRIDEKSHAVVLIAVMDSRQSIEKLLYEVNILI